MAISYVNKNSAVGKAVQLTGVTAGNLIVCMLQWQDNATTPTLSDGTNSPTGYGTVVTNINAQLIRFAYWLSSPKSGTVTYTWTASGGGHTAHVFEMSCSGTWGLDTVDAGATGASGTAVSANETSSETSMVAFGGAGFYYSTSYSSGTLDSGAVDQVTSATDSSYGALGVATMRVMSNPGTYGSSIIASYTLEKWAADLIAFKETSSSSSVPVFMYNYRLRRN